jgi:hypothetical protein
VSDLVEKLRKASARIEELEAENEMLASNLRAILQAPLVDHVNPANSRRAIANAISKEMNP